jgi:hypothetical protein
MALLVALHDRVGPKEIGNAINLLDRRDQRRRVNGVRDYTFQELKAALLDGVKATKARNAIAELLP